MRASPRQDRFVLGALAAASLLSPLAACGSGSGGPADAAADAEVDAVAAADASVDAAVDAAPAVRRSYVLAQVDLPTETGGALRLDLDGNGARENGLARLIVGLATAARDPALFQAPLDRGSARGEVITLATLDLPAAGDGEARLVSLEGDEASPAPCSGPGDAACGRHLVAGASFRQSPQSPVGSAVAGMIASWQVTGGPGTLILRLPLASPPVALRLAHARMELTVGRDGSVHGLLGGGLRKEDIRLRLVPYLTSVATRLVRASCTEPTHADCGCVAGESAGKNVLRLFDKNPADCAITESEVADSTFTATSLEPDLDLAPVDRQNDHVSAVLGVTLLPAVIRP